MKKVEVVLSKEVEVKPLDLSAFTEERAQSGAVRRVSKKEIREIAEGLGLPYDDTQIAFAKKLLNAYIKKEAV
ncbi:hypothetical protein [Sulfurovum sp.]|uniref:hypothetical protein n=1 Tax=Sulfurovum sp. TaxID=1969726 RepID=UPI0025FF4739|nr:hypothetical protein [Sulfurovum sp.]